MELPTFHEFESLVKARKPSPLLTVFTTVSLFMDSVVEDVQNRGSFESVVGDSKPIRLPGVVLVNNKTEERWKQNYFCCPVSGQNKVSVLLQNVSGCVRKNPVGSEKAVAEKFLFTDCTCPGGKGHRATCVHLSGASV